MSSWIESILNDFIPEVSNLTLVSDPDRLLSEEKLAQELIGRGFHLIVFDDPVEFRYAFESKYRSIWDQGGHKDLIVISHLQVPEIEILPFDLLHAGRRLSFSLAAFFPNFSYPVIENLDRSLLSSLFDAQSKSSPERMGDNATKDFILRHVFGIAPELIGSDVELLGVLLRLHYGNKHIPQVLADRFVHVLQRNGSFNSWPLDEIVPDADAFFAFLQERWLVFMSRLGNADKAEKDSNECALKYPGPPHIPFEDQDIKVYIDNLFVEGRLVPINANDLALDKDSWVRCGIAPASADEEVRISRLFDIVEYDPPGKESRHSEWAAFALKWAELSVLVHCGENAEYKSRLKVVGNTLNKSFFLWLTENYASLMNLPPTNPAMLHHLPRHLARNMEGSEGCRIALIVVDGLAMDQWVTIRNILEKQDNELIMKESAIFAWIPTLTSVSRQSIFSGKEPIYFPSTINSTNSEEKLWNQFWENHGLDRRDVAYKRGMGNGNVFNVLDAVIHPKTRVVGLVVDKVDKIMHGMQLGASGMHNQIRQWCQGGYLATLIGYLLDHDYDVWLTSDHGNIECEGKGRPSEGVIAETRGERVRVYPTPELRAHVAKAFDFAHEWQPVGLPPGYFPLVASGRDAFVNPNGSIVGHGGVAIEEVIVPFVKIERRLR